MWVRNSVRALLVSHSIKGTHAGVFSRWICQFGHLKQIHSQFFWSPGRDGWEPGLGWKSELLWDSKPYVSTCSPQYGKSQSAAAKSLQSCSTLCDPIDSSPPSSPVPGILQARTLEWGAISFSSAWKWKVKVESLSCVWLLVTPWTAAYQAPPPMGFSRQEYWSAVPLHSPKVMFRKWESEIQHEISYTKYMVDIWI